MVKGWIVRMGLKKELLPYLKRLLISRRTSASYLQINQKVSLLQSNCQISQCIQSFGICTLHRQEKQGRYKLTNKIYNISSSYVLNVDLLSAKRTDLTLSVNGTSLRYYSTKSKLSLTDSVYISYLQSLAEEFKIVQDVENENEKSFRTDLQQKMYLSRYQFLKNANEVISKFLLKQNEIMELRNLCLDEKDTDMKQMMENEIQLLDKCMVQYEDELIEVLAGEEPADNNDIILEVSAGVGGQEAMLFCVEIFNMYNQFGLRKGWNVTPVSNDESELGGYRKASVEISGLDVYKWLKYEVGVHRVQRVPKTEKAGRVHTSTVTVSVLPQPREIDIQIEKKDLKIETFRGSGPGGQSVNTTDSAVRITHLPTGTVAECKQERSQIKNKDYAMKTLKFRLYQAQLEEELANRRATRKMQIGSRGRSEKIRTYNFQQDRVTDHRVKESYSNLADFMTGGEGLDDLMSSLQYDHKYRTVESMVDEYETSLKKCNKKI